MIRRYIFLFLALVVGFVLGAISPELVGLAGRARLKASHVLWFSCVVSLVFGIGLGYHALRSPTRANDPPSNPPGNDAGLAMWTAVAALALSGILATVATKVQQAGW